MDPVEMFFPDEDHPVRLPELDEPIPEPLRESLERGLEQSAAGELHDLGSFAEYAERDECDPIETPKLDRLMSEPDPWTRAAERIKAATPTAEEAGKRLSEAINRLEGAEPHGEAESPAEPDSAIVSAVAALPERERHAWENFTDLAENGDTPQARAYWQAQADSLIAKDQWARG
jgi:hypothetical protein